jgi:hypothetical protein
MTADAHSSDDREPEQGATASDDVVGRGIEALQAAAAEAISAARAVLDVAEELLTDPRTAAAVSNVLGSMARSATRSRPPEGPDDEDGVQRIPVS